MRVATLVLLATQGAAFADHHEKIKVLYMGGRGHDSPGYEKFLTAFLEKRHVGSYVAIPPQ